MEKLRNSMCFSCCFRASDADSLAHDPRPSSLLRNSSSWIRSKAHDSFPDVRAFFSRIGRHHPRRPCAANFRYDPLSYSLNFDDGPDDDDLISPVECRYRSFSSRLPSSPPPPASSAAAGDVICGEFKGENADYS